MTKNTATANSNAVTQFVRSTVDVNAIERDAVEDVLSGEALIDYVGGSIDPVDMLDDDDSDELKAHKEKCWDYIKSLQTSIANGIAWRFINTVNHHIELASSTLNNHRVVINLSQLDVVDACSIHALMDYYVKDRKQELEGKGLSGVEYISKFEFGGPGENYTPESGKIVIVMPTRTRSESHHGRTCALKVHEVMDCSVYEIMMSRAYRHAGQLISSTIGGGADHPNLSELFKVPFSTRNNVGSLLLWDSKIDASLERASIFRETYFKWLKKYMQLFTL